MKLTEVDLAVMADMNSRKEFLFKKGEVEIIAEAAWRRGRVIKKGTIDKLLYLGVVQIGRMSLCGNKKRLGYKLTDEGIKFLYN